MVICSPTPIHFEINENHIVKSVKSIGSVITFSIFKLNENLFKFIHNKF